MAEAFVKADIHLILFTILYRDEGTNPTLSLPPSTLSLVNVSPFLDVSASLPTNQIDGARTARGDTNESDGATEQRDCEY